MLMATDGHSHCAFQATISNNGDCLRGTVTQLLKLPESSQPYGLAFTGTDLYPTSDGWDYQAQPHNFRECHHCEKRLTTLPYCPLNRCAEWRRRCIHWPRLSCYSSLIRRRCTQSNNGVCRIQWRNVKSWFLPCCFILAANSLMCWRETVFVTDTAAGAVKLITPTTSLCKLLEVLDLPFKMFGIHRTKRDAYHRRSRFLAK